MGFTTLQMVLFVVIPQAVRRALPGCGNEIIYLIKYSSLAYVITFIELTGHARELTARSFHYIEIYFTAGMYYLAMTTLAAWILKWLEKKAYVPGFGAPK
jgi:polar amino acid transport system permease protein